MTEQKDAYERRHAARAPWRVTSSRLPFALGLIRRLGAAGHEVYAADTCATAPGSHSTYVAESIVTGSPKFDTRR